MPNLFCNHIVIRFIGNESNVVTTTNTHESDDYTTAGCHKRAD